MQTRVRLGDVFTLIGGGTPSTNRIEYWGEGTPWFSSADIDAQGKITYRRCVTQIGVENSTTNIVPANTVIVVTRVGLGKIAILPEKMCFSQDMQALLAKDDTLVYSRKYLFYQLVYTMETVKYQGQGTTISGITKKRLADVMLYLPGIEEQQRIVARIEELFSQLDDAEATLQKTKAQLALYRQAVLKEAFEGRLTQSFRDSNDLMDWKIISITQAIEQRKNALKAGPFGSTLKKECYVPSGYKVYGQEQVIAGNENIGDYYIDEEKYKELISCSIVPHDILISLVGTVGKVLVLSDHCLPGIINPRLIKITLNERVMMPLFFKYYFESEYLKSLYKQKVHGATMDVLNMSMVKELPFPICDIREQGEVIKEIESRLSVCENIEQTVDVALRKASAMRQSILKQAFGGAL